MKHKYGIFKTDGSVEFIYTENELALDTMQKIVGGNIERVHPAFSEGKIQEPHEVYVHEEGKFEQLERNSHFNEFTTDYLAGDALVHYLEAQL